jgi:hypothetical protein
MTWNTARSYDHAYIRNIEDGAGEIVAQVLDLDNYVNDINRARLIAAAPDLLAALRQFVIAYETNMPPPGYSPENWRKMRADCLAAVAKAEGANQ